MGVVSAAHLSDVLVTISEAEQEVGQNVHHVGLKQFAQHVTQHLKGKQGTLVGQAADQNNTATYAVGLRFQDVQVNSDITEDKCLLIRVFSFKL